MTTKAKAGTEKKAKVIDIEKATPEELMALANDKIRERREAQREANREKINALKERKKKFQAELSEIQRSISKLTGQKTLPAFHVKIVEQLKSKSMDESELIETLNLKTEKKTISLKKALARLVQRSVVKKDGDVYSFVDDDE